MSVVRNLFNKLSGKDINDKENGAKSWREKMLEGFESFLEGFVEEEYPWRLDVEGSMIDGRMANADDREVNGLSLDNLKVMEDYRAYLEQEEKTNKVVASYGEMIDKALYKLFLTPGDSLSEVAPPKDSEEVPTTVESKEAPVSATEKPLYGRKSVSPSTDDADKIIDRKLANSGGCFPYFAEDFAKNE